MKQIFVGILLGVILSSVAFFFFYNFQFVQKIGTDSEEILGEWSMPPEKEKQSGASFPEEHKIAVKYIHENLGNIVSSPENIKKFISDSPYSFGAALYALKHDNYELWSLYWLSLYEGMDNPPFEKLVFEEKIQSSFQDIKNNALEFNKYKQYLLDGAIYFSSENIASKLQTCENEFRVAGSESPSDGTKYCQSMSYFYEAIRKNDMKKCEKIEYIPKDTFLRENCKALFLK